MTKLENFRLWTLGKDINDKVLDFKEFAFSQYNNLGTLVTSSFNKNSENISEDVSKEQDEATNLKTENSNTQDDFKELIEQHNLNIPKVLPENQFAVGYTDIFAGDKDFTEFAFPEEALPITLKPGDKVLVAGDSMQQGVGRHIRSYLSHNYKIQSKDLSKQSTGLLNPNNLDWNKTITQELASDQNYKLLIMLLGANDNYGLYDRVTKKGYPFGSLEWRAHYLQRIMSIMYQAHEHNVRVIWLTVPNIRNPELNNKMQVVNSLFRSAAKQYGVLLVDTNVPLHLSGNSYSPSIYLNDKLVKTRSDDGIHFTPAGEKLIANYVLSYIEYINNLE
ncbi:DUF459 domain-containing protein [Psittacicella hinzii]|uniref:SGNH/GDSL hydrolase family protein n=1 Tax=Psittacicella hinzii TaxID=2028575 RepID=UPI001CA69711|nr:DUF459 domain-containing protein [Psittacicella hinzii]